jgi:hypothetical protein
MKLNKDLLMKVGIVAAIALIIYLVYRSRQCKDTYAQWAPSTTDDYAENMFEEEAADYADEGDEYTDQGGVENYTLMESTLDDDQANAMFEPEM